MTLAEAEKRLSYYERLLKYRDLKPNEQKEYDKLRLLYVELYWAATRTSR